MSVKEKLGKRGIRTLTILSSVLLSVGLSIFFNLRTRWGLWIGIIWAIVFTGLIIYISSPFRYETSKIERCIWDIYDELCNIEHLPTKDVRCTLWVPHPKKEELLIQLINYIPHDGGKNRTLHVSKGITGFCYRTRKQKLEILDDISHKETEKFKIRLVEKWGFSYKDVENLKTDRRGYFAIPIIGVRNQILGIFYWDAKDPYILAQIELQDKIQEYIPKVRSLLYPYG